MKKLLLIAGCAALAACGQNEEAAPAEETNVVVAEPEANVAAPAEFTLAETTWDYTQDGKPHTTSIDGSGQLRYQFRYGACRPRQVRNGRRQRAASRAR